MKQLQDILYRAPIEEVRGSLEVQVNDFFFDSRHVVPGSLFIAVSGTQVDGHSYIEKAIDNGAIAVVCEVIPSETRGDISYIKVRNSANALSHIAANYYDNPAEHLQVVGITGTNGKTTTATLLYQLFNEIRYPAGLVSTISIRIGDKEVPSTHTTPDAKTLQRMFRDMVREGCEYCFMEVSSHALVQQRVAGVPFSGAVFTNITHDHLDYHGTFDDYKAAKQILFNELRSSSFALVNTDDRNGKFMVRNSNAKQKSYSIHAVADYMGRIIENTMEGLQMEVDGKEIWFRLTGGFNAYNLLAVYATSQELGIPQDEVLVEMSRLEGVEGRFQTIAPPDRQFVAVVDYAHTPDALKNVLDTIRDINGDAGKIITVVGCGGNRDKEKRPKMAGIAVEGSDQVVITSDNPRDKEPAVIMQEMMTGVPVSQRKKVLTIENRKEAIAVACRLAAKNDIILVAGKGHETYQEIKGVKHPFDDREVLLETFKTLNL